MSKKITSMLCTMLFACTLAAPLHAGKSKSTTSKKRTQSTLTQASDYAKYLMVQIHNTLSSLNKKVIIGTLGAITVTTGTLFALLSDQSTHTSHKNKPYVGKHESGTHGAINANQFFKQVTGLSEQDFRAQLGWDESLGRFTKVPTDSLTSFNVWRDRWIAKDPRRNAIFDGAYSFETIAQLDSKVQGKIKPLTLPRFSILLHDRNNPLKTDITHLHIHPFTPTTKSLFQVASTLRGPLEGGMHAHSAYLTDMLHSPVQGELSSIAVAGATIFRKYFMPTIRFIERSHKTEEKAPPLYTLFDTKQSDIPNRNNVSLFTHYDIPVTGTVIVDRSSARNHTLNPVTKGPAIAQIFTSAIDLTPYLCSHHGIVPVHEQRRAAELLKLEYMATLKKAYELERPRVFLTMLGGGAFRNDISWIQKAITNPEFAQFIVDAGLDVTVIYRPDNPHREKPVRDAQGDKEFIQALYAAADEINGTRQAEETLKSPDMQSYFKYIDNTYARATEKPTRMIL